MKKICYQFKVIEYFLAVKNWDRVYNPGEKREVVISFLLDTEDDNYARQKLLDSAEKDDVKLEIIAMSKCVIDIPAIPQTQPILKKLTPEDYERYRQESQTEDDQWGTIAHRSLLSWMNENPY